MVREEEKERAMRLEDSLKGKVGEPVLLVNSQFEETPRGGNPCWGGGGTDLIRQDDLELGILTKEKISKGERKIRESGGISGFEISCSAYSSHEPLGYSFDSDYHPKLFTRKEGKILIPEFSDLIIGRIEDTSKNSRHGLFSSNLLIGDQVPDFFNRGGFNREILDDYYLDASYFHALSLINARDKAPEKFVKAYEEFVEKTITEVLEVLRGNKKVQLPNLKERVIMAELDKSGLEVNLGRGHYIKVAEALQFI